MLKEEKRLFRLQQFQVLDTESEKPFDDLAILAAEICETPYSAISLVDRNRQWFKARHGFSVPETLREESFCNHTILMNTMLVVEDALVDERFRNMTFAEGYPAVRFYAAVPLITSDGQAIGTLCVMDTKVRSLDRKQRFTLEALAKQIMNLLELRLQNQELDEARKEAQKAVQAKAEFLSQMSHELRTPLNGIIGMVHWLIQDNLRPEQLEMVNTLKFSAENLLSLINDILDFNKLQAQKMSLEKVEFNLVETLKQLNKSFTVMAKQKGIQLQTHFCENLPVVKGDPLRLFQVLNNLLGNAIKFTPEGKVVLDVSPVMETENFITLRFSVKDTGIGIPLDKQESIFEEFSQATIDISRKFGGTGLGLTITKSLVRLMEGDISVQSEPGKGAEFVFSISFQKVSRGFIDKSSGPVLPLVHFSDKKVLLIEDNRINQMVNSKFLSRWGMKISIANNGREAVLMAAQEKYDLMLMDLQMPELDGFEATRRIRQQSDYNRRVPIIALTASAVLQVKEEAFRAGVSDFLLKPFKPENLYNMIYKHLVSGEEEVAMDELRQRIDELAEGDGQFKKELLSLYIKSFRNILDELNAGILKESEPLRRARHKHKSTFQLLNLAEFEAAFLSLQALVDDTEVAKASIPQKIIEINHMGEQLICKLEAIHLNP